MRSLAFISCAALSIGFIALGAPASEAASGYRVSGPFTHENLSLYFVHGEADKGPVPLTLAEALESIESASTKRARSTSLRSKISATKKCSFRQATSSKAANRTA